MTTDRREHKRVEIKGDVLVYYKAGNSLVTATNEVSIKDVSAGGAKITSESPYPLSFAVNMNISLPDGPVKMQGAVVRVEEVEENEAYDIGIKFFGLADNDVQRLTRFIAEHLQGTHNIPLLPDSATDLPLS